MRWEKVSLVFFDKKIHFFSWAHYFETVIVVGKTEEQLEGNINSRLRQLSNVKYSCCVVEYHKVLSK